MKQSRLSEISISTHCKKRKIIRNLIEGCDKEVQKKCLSAPVQRAAQTVAYYAG
jgi:hypothetical protein